MRYNIENISHIRDFSAMKYAVIVIVLVLFIGVFVPPTIGPVIAHQGLSAIQTIDVCHAGTQALSSSGDMPCTDEGMRGLTPTLLNYSATRDLALTRYFSFIEVNEHPPQS